MNDSDELEDSEEALNNLAQSIHRGPKKKSQKNSIVLEIYRRFLGFQAIHCTFWVIACLFMFFSTNENIKWDLSIKVKFMYFIGSGLLIGMHAGLIDTVQVFLAQDSVGETAIDCCSRFAFFWGLLNALICIALASIGRNTNPNILKFREYMKAVPWWNPFFVRTLIMLLFNGILMAKRFLKQHSCNCKKTDPATLPQGIKLEVKNEEPTREKDIPENKEHRSAWILLGIFNLIGSSGIIFLFICDYGSRRGPNTDPEYTHWTAALGLWTFLVFLCHTPILYQCLIKDSLYWSHLWVGTLTAISSNARQLATEENVVIEYEAISYKKILGRGGFSSVYKGTVWDAACAIKVLSFPELTKEVVERFLDEVRIFVKFRHPNLVQFVGACISPPQLCIIMELCNRLSMSDRLKNFNQDIWKSFEKERQRRWKKKISSKEVWSSNGFSIKRKKKIQEENSNNVHKITKNVSSNLVEKLVSKSPQNELKRCNSSPSFYNTFPKSVTKAKMRETKSEDVGSLALFPDKLFTFGQAVDIALGIAKALQYMHTTHGVLHRDLKSSNILFDSRDRPKICDFGLSRELHKLNERNSFAGTLAYMSPEIIQMERATAKSDVYSFAILFWELLMSKLAWTESVIINSEEDWEQVDISKPFPKPRTYSHRHIMTKVVVEDQRPEINEDSNIHPILHVLLRECWNCDVDLRPSFPDVVTRLEAFKTSQHLKYFENFSDVFGQAKSTQWLTIS